MPFGVLDRDLSLVNGTDVQYFGHPTSEAALQAAKSLWSMARIANASRGFEPSSKSGGTVRVPSATPALDAMKAKPAASYRIREPTASLVGPKSAQSIMMNSSA